MTPPLLFLVVNRRSLLRRCPQVLWSRLLLPELHLKDVQSTTMQAPSGLRSNPCQRNQYVPRAFHLLEPLLTYRPALYRNIRIESLLYIARLPPYPCTNGHHPFLSFSLHPVSPAVNQDRSRPYTEPLQHRHLLMSPRFPNRRLGAVTPLRQGYSDRNQCIKRVLRVRLYHLRHR